MASPGQQLSNDQEEVAYWTDETVSSDEEDEDNSDIDDETMNTNEEGISYGGIEGEENDEDEISGLDPINKYRDRLLFSWELLSEAERTEHRRLGESCDPEFWEAISKPGGAGTHWEERLRGARARASTADTSGDTTVPPSESPTDLGEQGDGNQGDQEGDEQTAYSERPGSVETASSRFGNPTQQ